MATTMMQEERVSRFTDLSPGETLSFMHAPVQAKSEIIAAILEINEGKRIQLTCKDGTVVEGRLHLDKEAQRAVITDSLEPHKEIPFADIGKLHALEV
jgi:hypothetical protein